MLGTSQKAIGGTKLLRKKLAEKTTIQANTGGIVAGARRAAGSRGMARIFLAVLFGIGGFYLLVKSRKK